MTTQRSQSLSFFGGLVGGSIPFILLLMMIAVLSLSGDASIHAFWGAAWLSLSIGIFLTRDKRAYCNAILNGLGQRNGIVIVAAWIFAGVFGKLLTRGGLIEGFLWFGTNSGVSGEYFALLSFLAAMILSVGTGTSTGTVIALVPVLYPAGVALGADPVVQAVGILSGAAFGDNLSPISDTTIVSAFTQEAEIRDVVRSRLPLSLTAAACSAIIILIFGQDQNHGGSLQAGMVQSSPEPLLLLLSFVIVLLASLARRHLIEALIYGSFVALIIGILIGKISLSELWSTGERVGIIEEGISGVVGAIIFALLILAMAQVLRESGLIDRILNNLLKISSRSIRMAELTVVAMSIFTSVFVSANAAAELIVGPTFVKRIGEAKRLSPARRANLMDCSVCTVFYMLPWSIVVIVWFQTVSDAAASNGLPGISAWMAFLSPYAWALLCVLLISILTGWNRQMIREDGNGDFPRK